MRAVTVCHNPEVRKSKLCFANKKLRPTPPILCKYEPVAFQDPLPRTAFRTLYYGYNTANAIHDRLFSFHEGESKKILQTAVDWDLMGGGRGRGDPELNDVVSIVRYI